MKIAHKVMKIDTMNKNHQTKYDQNKERKKMWENYVGLIQVEVKHTYPELYTARAVLVFLKPSLTGTMTNTNNEILRH